MSFPCECGVNPQPGDGPLEHCPVHGNPQLFARWLQESHDRIEQLEAGLARARDALSNWYGDGSFSANTFLGGHTDWCIDHCWPGATEPRGTDDEVLDSVFVDDHADCICGWQADKVRP